MDKKKLLKQIGQKLQEIRQPLNHSHSAMADSIGINRSSYFRYENGETTPQVTSLYKLGSKYGISLDWLIMDRGPMYCNGKESGRTKEVIQKIPHIPETSRQVSELLEHMERIPLLRYEILAHFYSFKEDRKEVVETAMKKKGKTQEAVRKPRVNDKKF